MDSIFPCEILHPGPPVAPDSQEALPVNLKRSLACCSGLTAAVTPERLFYQPEQGDV